MEGIALVQFIRQPQKKDPKPKPETLSDWLTFLESKHVTDPKGFFIKTVRTIGDATTALENTQSNYVIFPAAGEEGISIFYIYTFSGDTYKISVKPKQNPTDRLILKQYTSVLGSEPEDIFLADIISGLSFGAQGGGRRRRSRRRSRKANKAHTPQ